MAGLISLIKRNLTTSNPPQALKEAQALRFGMLGAAQIAPDALIRPAKSHASVVVTAVASRDDTKANRFAKQHGIPKVYSGPSCYQSLLNDSDIDCVYNPLPNGLHFEWTMRALEAGKHVLLEKPCTDTVEEAQKLFEFAASKGLVLLEAYHYRFHPVAQRVKEIVDSGELGSIKSVYSELSVPKDIFVRDGDIRFDYSLGGGATMDMGVYVLSSIRYITSSNPVEIVSATPIRYHKDPDKVDSGMRVVYSLPNSVSADSYVDFATRPWGPFGLIPQMPQMNMTIKLEGGEISVYNFVLPQLYHYIKIKPSRGKSRTEKHYKPKSGLGEEWWSTYRYQLEAFVEKVKGSEPQSWVSAEDSIAQMEWIGKIYDKAFYRIFVQRSTLN